MPEESRRGVGPPGIRVTDSCELPYAAGNQIQALLQEQRVLLMAELPLQLSVLFLEFTKSDCCSVLSELTAVTYVGNKTILIKSQQSHWLMAALLELG